MKQSRVAPRADVRGSTEKGVFSPGNWG